MDPRTRLAANLANEVEAYGYTLTIWGAGALLIDAFGVPELSGALAYIAGSLVGFAALTLATFRGLMTTVAVEGSQSPLAASTVHVVATVGSLAVASVTIHGLPLSALWSFASVGFLVTVTYNLLLLAEELLVDALDG